MNGLYYNHGSWLIILALFEFAIAPTLAVSAQSQRLHPRQKIIDFEDELIEGINKRPLDSLSQISERNRKNKKTHLYRKRIGFRTEIAETLRELRDIP